MAQTPPITPTAGENRTSWNESGDYGSVETVNVEAGQVGLEGRPTIEIEQGPEWLVDLYLTPPDWLNPLLQLVAVAVLALVAYRLYQRGWRVDGETQLEMGRIAGTVVGVIVGVLAMANLTNQPYAVDVAVGLVAGWGGTQAALSARVRGRAREAIPDDEQRRAAAWALLVALAMLAPMLVAVNGEGMTIFGGRLAVAAVGVGMACLNLADADD